MKLKLNTDLGGYKSGQTITIKDRDGIALEQFWRDRIKDSQRDNCVTIIKPNRKTEKIRDSKKEIN